jgi:hypothetical protein
MDCTPADKTSRALETLLVCLPVPEYLLLRKAAPLLCGDITWSSFDQWQVGESAGWSIVNRCAVCDNSALPIYRSCTAKRREFWQFLFIEQIANLAAFFPVKTVHRKCEVYSCIASFPFYCPSSRERKWRKVKLREVSCTYEWQSEVKWRIDRISKKKNWSDVKWWEVL